MTSKTYITNYSPFGVLLENRNFTSEKYRYGFQGQERDDEIAGNGNSYTAEFWQYDPRLGRRWDLDPVIKIHESSYAVFANNPIWFVDINGLDTVEVFKNSGKINNYIKTDKGDDVFYFVSKDKSRNIVRGEQKTFKEGTILDIRKGEGKGGSDIYKLRGDENSQELFEWYANNIKVEFSLFKTGEKGESGLNFITTSHEKITDRGARWLFDTQLKYGYTIREHIHNHPSNSSNPSGAWDNDETVKKAGEWGDVWFANHVYYNKKGLGTTVFKIYTSKDGKYRTYNKNTRLDKPIPKTLPTFTITTKKK